ncbi:hypothetical protein ABH926_001896 [Catenulispora sp. GP43]
MKLDGTGLKTFLKTPTTADYPVSKSANGLLLYATIHGRLRPRPLRDGRQPRRRLERGRTDRDPRRRRQRNGLRGQPHRRRVHGAHERPAVADGHIFGGPTAISPVVEARLITDAKR